MSKVGIVAAHDVFDGEGQYRAEPAAGGARLHELDHLLEDDVARMAPSVS